MPGRERRRERREGRREERATFGLRGNAERYRMREKLLSIGDDFWIEDENGQRAFKVDGKALRVRKTLILEDPRGVAQFKIQERLLRVRDVMEIEDAGGTSVATVTKAMISPLRDRFTVSLASGGQLNVQGNIIDHEYTIEDGRRKIAEVSRRWFRVRDTYGVEVAPGQSAALLLAIAVCIDQLTTR